MKRFLNAVLLTLAGILAAPSFAAGISEGAVKKLMADVDKAIPARNVAVIERLLADDVAIELTVNVDGNIRRFDMSRDEYLTMVRQAWSAATTYTYKRTNQKIVIQGRKAVVTADVTESLSSHGRTVVTRSQETAVVEDVRGTLQATAIRVVSLAEPTAGTLL